MRVVAVEQYGAGPWATLQLADLGAEVIKVEDPQTGGDVSRHVPPYQERTDSLFFESFNRGKRSIAIDLRDPEGREAFEALVARSDAVFCNLRGDGAQKLRLEYSDLAHLSRALVCCSLSAFGQTGPRLAEGGYDFTIQGLAGWQSVTGGPDDPPLRSGLSLVDFCGGYVAAIALAGALWRARESGVGCDVDVSLFETALAQLNYMATWVASRGYEPVRRERSAHQSIVPFGNFPTADGWIVIACPKENLWRNLCRALERDGWSQDPRFETFAGRSQNREALIAAIDEVLASEGTAVWVERLTAERVPCARINDIVGALNDPQSSARDSIGNYWHPVLGEVRQVRTPFHMPGVSRQLVPAPALGADTASVLSEICGWEPERIEALEAGTPAP